MGRPPPWRWRPAARPGNDTDPARTTTILTIAGLLKTKLVVWLGHIAREMKLKTVFALQVKMGECMMDLVLKLSGSDSD